MGTIDPTFRDISPGKITPADVSTWYNSQWINYVPDTIAPYLAAHGFLVQGGVPYTINGEFAGWRVNMIRQSFNEDSAIQALMDLMLFLHNEGREHNDTRYEDLVRNLTTLLTDHQDEIEAFISDEITDATTGHITLVLAKLDTINAEHNTFESDLYSYDTGDRDTELTALKAIWKNAATTLEAEYNTMTSGLDIPALIADVEVAIDALDDALTDFVTATQGLSATLLSDYNSHETTATAFLTNLGVTELARINDQFDNLKADNNQKLTDRGFYSSAMVTQMETQVERERNEAIGELNDRLNREKWENQHKLYEQKYRMRLGALDVTYKALQGASEVLNARLSHAQWASKVRHEVAILSINAKLALLEVREKYYKFLLQSIDWETNRRIQIYDKIFASQLEQMRTRMAVAGFHYDLVKYDLDSRNNLALGLFKFVEGREDDYPGFGELTSLVTSLGDDTT